MDESKERPALDAPVIDTIKGKKGTDANSQEIFYPVDVNKKPFVYSQKRPEGYNNKGEKTLLNDSHLGQVIDIMVETADTPKKSNEQPVSGTLPPGSSGNKT